MIECDRYAIYTYVILSNLKVSIFESINHRKYTITEYKLKSDEDSAELDLIHIHPISTRGGMIVTHGCNCYNIPTDLIYGIDNKVFYELRISPKNAYSQQLYIISACYNMDGSLIIFGCEDGSLHVFDAQNT